MASGENCQTLVHRPAESLTYIFISTPIDCELWRIIGSIENIQFIELRFEKFLAI